MTASGSKSLASIGFLTVCQHPDRGHFGGYLVLNLAGRPLEFHCTVPLRPSRAQEILYGPTLMPFLYGEQIGLTLLNKATSKPLFVCTDIEPALSLRDHASVPLLMVFDTVCGESTESASGPDRLALRLDDSHASLAGPHGNHLIRFTLGANSVAVSPAYSGDRDEVLQRWQAQPGHLDLREPFHRIRLAIEEAQRGAGRSPD